VYGSCHSSILVGYRNLRICQTSFLNMTNMLKIANPMTTPSQVLHLRSQNHPLDKQRPPVITWQRLKGWLMVALIFETSGFALTLKIWQVWIIIFSHKKWVLFNPTFWPTWCKQMRPSNPAHCQEACLGIIWSKAVLKFISVTLGWDFELWFSGRVGFVQQWSMPNGFAGFPVFSVN
jgi:hypothetical protein